MFPCFKRTKNQVKSNRPESSAFLYYARRIRFAMRKQRVAWLLRHQQMRRVSQKRGALRGVEMSVFDANVLKDILGLGVREAKQRLGQT